MKITKKVMITLMAVILMTLGKVPGNWGDVMSTFAATNLLYQDGIGSSNVPVVLSEVEGTTFTQYQDWPSEFTKGQSSFAGGVFDGENVWMIPYNASHLIKINSTTGDMTAYNNWPNGFTKGSNAFAGGVFDGVSLWLIPYSANQVIQVNITTGEMKGYSNWPGGSRGSDQFIGGAFDGTNIWLVPYSGSQVIKLDTHNGEMTSYNSWPSGTTLGSYPFNGAIFDGTDVWLIPSGADRLIRIDPSTGDMTGNTNWPVGFAKGTDAFWGGTFDGTNIWLIPYNATHVVKFDTTTGVMTGYDGWPEGFTKGSGSFAGGVFDGENIWLIPSNSSALVKVNASTGEMTSYNDWPTGFTKGSSAFFGGVYDGENIWMVPFGADRVIKFGSITLSNLTLSSGHLSPAFNGATRNYTANVGSEVTSLDITPTTENNSAAITVNGTVVANGQPYSVPLNGGDNTIVVNVSTSNKDTITYEIIVTRAQANSTIEHVHAIADIHVPVSADTASVHLPNTVGVTLSDTTTPSVPVTWDTAAVAFDGNTPGKYLFTGTLTLPTGVTNPRNLQANVNVIVKSAGTGTDTEAPKWPAGTDLSLTDITTTSIRLSWQAATDNIAVISYRIYVDGIEKALVGNHEHSYVVTGLNTKTTYNFSVLAYDTAGNASLALGKSATTLSPPVNPGGGGNYDSEPSYVPSSNNHLKELIVLLNGQKLTLTPKGSAFTLKTEASEIELFPTTAHSAAKVTLNGNSLVEGQKTLLHEGTNIFELTIEAENGTKKTYTVTIQRTPTKQVPPPIVPVEPDPVKPVLPIEFDDTTGHWAEEYIQQATTLGILKGYSDGTFKPNNPLTRAQAASIIVRALHLQTDEAAPFKDIGNYAVETQAEIAAAYQFGIIKGSNGDFKPSDKITRAQIALMIQRAYEYKTRTKYEATKAPYSDFGNYDAETTNAISMLHELDIATGSEGKFNPGNQTTRAQAAKIFVNLLARLK